MIRKTVCERVARGQRKVADPLRDFHCVLLILRNLYPILIG